MYAIQESQAQRVNKRRATCEQRSQVPFRQRFALHDGRTKIFGCVNLKSVFILLGGSVQISNRYILNVERDSVCAGDDVDAPHAERFELAPSDSISKAVSEVVKSRYLAGIAGGKATWIVETAGKPLAVVAQQWASPRFLIEETARLSDCTQPDAPTLFFRYWCQVEPSTVFECLKLGKPLPDRYGRDG